MSAAAELLAAPAPAPGRVPLSQAIAEAGVDRQPAPGFTAWLEGQAWRVTSVLERTAVIEQFVGDRWSIGKQLARLDALEVEPEAITWQPRAEARRFVHRPGGRRAGRELAATRAASDQRALRDQARHNGRPLAVAPFLVEPEPLLGPVPCPVPGNDVAKASPAEVAAVEVAPPGATGDDVQVVAPEAAGPAACGRCGRALACHNHSGLCTPCQLTCPGCGGRKSPRAARCRRCRPASTGAAGHEPRPGEAGPSLAERALEELPARAQELLDQVVTLARYAYSLEEELDRYRAAMREIQRRAGVALGEGAP